MSSHPTKPQTPEQDDAYYRAILQELIEGAAQLARQILQNATPPVGWAQPIKTQENPAPAPEAGPPAPETDPTVAYDRIARTIRRTIALARHIADNPAGQPREPKVNRAAARQKLIRGVEDAIDLKQRHQPKIDAEALYAELNERLLDPELEFDLQGRNVDDIIEEIARDLGIAQQGKAFVWKRRKPKDIAELRTRAAAPPGRKPSAPLPAGPPDSHAASGA
jgi:hypothetical protein